jgi:transcriptional/translational regulatory protein YebC/TACO1
MVTCAPQDLAAVRAALDAAGMVVDSAEVAMVPSTTVPITEEGGVRKVLRLLEALDDDDDVQNVWSNFDTPDEVLAAAAAD